MVSAAMNIARIGLLMVGFIVCVASIFLPWWTVKTDFNGASSSTSVKPYDAGRLADDDEGDGLTLEAMLTGVFVSLAAVGVLATLYFHLQPVFGKESDPRFEVIGSAVTILFGLMAVLYTMFAWPNEFQGNTDFFDSQRFEGFGAQGAVSTYGDVGWYLGIAGAVLAPLGGFLMTIADRQGIPKELR